MFVFLLAASIDERMLLTLTRDDLRDLFSGPEHFLRRKHVWSIIHPEVLCKKYLVQLISRKYAFILAVLLFSHPKPGRPSATTET